MVFEILCIDLQRHSRFGSWWSCRWIWDQLGSWYCGLAEHAYKVTPYFAAVSFGEAGVVKSSWMRDLKDSSKVPTRLDVRIKMPSSGEQSTWSITWLRIVDRYSIQELGGTLRNRCQLSKFSFVDFDLPETRAFRCKSAIVLSSRKTSASSRRTTEPVSMLQSDVLVSNSEFLPQSHIFPIYSTVSRYWPQLARMRIYWIALFTVSTPSASVPMSPHVAR